MKRTTIIAEAGVNHNGNLSLAKKLIEVAAEANADYVKFQTFKTEKIVSAQASATDYQIKNVGQSQLSQFDLIKKLELDRSAHEQLISHCHKCGIKFLSTPFDPESVDLLEALGIDQYKIPSGEITNRFLLKKIGQKNKPVLLSTGMSTLGEIEHALDVLQQAGTIREKIIVLHCNTEYPTPMQDVNLQAMLTIRDALKVKVGYSDHTLGIEVSVAAVALGAVCIEKHFTLDRQMPGPDHMASLEPVELKAMVKAIRNIELAMGNGLKKPSDSEIKNIDKVRKSQYTVRPLTKGHILTPADIIALRPGDGISPMKEIVGRKLKRDLPVHHQIKYADLE